jgi:hypothetical protein
MIVAPWNRGTVEPHRGLASANSRARTVRHSDTRLVMRETGGHSCARDSLGTTSIRRPSINDTREMEK